MDCDVLAFDFLRDAFPEVDSRVIKATVLEHGDDIDSALSFLKSIINEEKAESLGQDLRADHALRQNSSTIDNDHHPEIGVSDVLVAPELSGSIISNIDHVSLEDIIEEAKRDKELVIDLIKEISNLRAKADQENVAALKAKMNAVTSGATVLKKADEVQSQVSQRKQENLLRRGEIYGEKAVLATEARELKLRVEQVKLQKESAVVTLREIQVKLQGCYDAAVEEKKMAEEEGRIKEEEAQKLLAEQEALMAIVKEESEKLETEAKVCLQLKEFLAHHGSIVDSLQGEMSILCEDVESFKRQVEEGMWSSVSTASSHSNVNPEGPYSFRKCNMPSRTTSSQDLGQGVDDGKQSHHGSSASSSQELAHLSVHSYVSSQEGEKGEQTLVQSKEDSEWCRQLVMEELHLHENGDDSTRSDRMGGIQSSLSSSRTHDNLSVLDGVNNFVRNWVDKSVRSYTSPLNNTGFPAEGDYELDNHHHTTERVNHGGGWVFTAELSDGSSSTSSSVVKINANDYRSE